MTTSTAHQLQITAREYLRVSQDASGRLVSVSQQHTEHAEAAADNGWQLGQPYTEAAAVSASRYSRKARGAFDDLTADLESGAFGAEILVMWEASRASRRWAEWARLVGALEDAGVQLYVASEDRLYDARKPRDRKALRESASDAEYESDKISSRVGRAMRAEAAAGKPHGRGTYGYRREYRIDDGSQLQAGEYQLSTGGRVGRQVPEPAEADAVRLVYRALLAGESARSIAAALAGHGPTRPMGDALAAEAETRRGRPAPGIWTGPRVRDIALNPAYAGKRLHQAGGHLASARAVSAGDFSVTSLVDASWPALVSLADWLAVHDRLTARKPAASPKSAPGTTVTHQTGRQPAHLLSMIALCQTCGGPLSVRYRHAAKRATYICHQAGHVSVDRDDLDALVTGAVLQRLAQPANYPVMAEAGGSAALEAARDQLAAVKREHAELAAMVGAGKLSAVLAAAAEPALLARIAEAEARLAGLQSPGQLSSLGLAPGADIFSRWQAAPLNARRQLVKTLVTVTVRAVGRSGRLAPAASRTEITWRQS